MTSVEKVEENEMLSSEHMFSMQNFQSTAREFLYLYRDVEKLKGRNF